MKCHAKPYEGDKPFIFFSYCHADERIVYPIIERMSMEGFRVWYDDGLHPGDDWPQEIAEHIHKAVVCIAAISEKSSVSHSCKNEVTFAVTNNKPLLSLVLESFNMPMGMRLQISNSTFIKLYEAESKAAFYENLLNAPSCQICRDAGLRANLEELAEWEKRCADIETIPKPDKPDVPPIFDPPIGLEKEPEEEPVERKRKGVWTRLKNEGNREVWHYFDAETGEHVSGYWDIYPPEEPIDGPNTGDGADNEPTVIGGVSPLLPPNGGEDVTVIVPEKRTAANIVRAQTGEVFRIDGVDATIGRSEKHSKIAVEDNSNRISKHHATFTVFNGNVFLQDNGSTNGTYHCDNRLKLNEQVLLEPLDVFSLSNEEFYFISTSVEHLFKKAVKLRKLYVFMAKSTYEWKMLNGESLPLDRNHKWRDGVLASNRVHRENEAELLYIDDRYYIHDINSANGVSVNGSILSRGEKVRLENGDTVSIAGTDFIYKEILLQLKGNE